MRLKNPVFLIDFDNTLIDTQGIKKLNQKRFASSLKGKTKASDFWSIYSQVNKGLGYFDIDSFTSEITKKYAFAKESQIKDVFYHVDFKSLLLPDVVKTLKYLKKVGKVIIYSLGHHEYQSLKIQKSGVMKIVGKNNVIVTQDKIQGIKVILKRLSKDGYENIHIIDDRADVLESARKFHTNSINIWVRYGKYKNIYPQDKYSVDIEINRLNEIKNVVENYVCKFKSPESGQYFQIWRGFTNAQRKKLITLTKTDSQIKKFTLDSNRFKDMSTLKDWEKKGKSIYVLTDMSQNMLGIAWFSKERFREYRSTFGIRLYHDARGKHLSEIFMRKVFNDSGQKDVWLKTKKINKPAIGLYKKFGFQEVLEDEENIFMTYRENS